MKDENYYCAECGAEVNADDNFCSVCGADLNAADAPFTRNTVPMVEPDEEDYGNADLNRTVVLQKYSDEMSAQIDKQVLNENGIYSIVSKDDAGGMTPNLQFVFKVRLLVLNKDLKRAKEILNIGRKKSSFDSFDSDMFAGLQRAVYTVENMDKGKDWYSRALEITPFIEEPELAVFDISGFELVLVPGIRPEAVSQNGQMPFWEVTDIEAVFKHLLLIGAQRNKDVTENGDGTLTASVIDPFGNIFGIIQNL